MLAEIAIAEAVGRQGKEAEGLHQSEDPGIIEAQARGSLLLAGDGLGESLEAFFTDATVVAQGLGAQKAPTWDKPGAYLPPCSGGRGNSYYVTVKAVHKTGDETHELGSVVVEMGKY